MKEGFKNTSAQNIIFITKNLAINPHHPAKTSKLQEKQQKTSIETSIKLNPIYLTTLGNYNMQMHNQAINLKVITQNMINKTLGNQKIIKNNSTKKKTIIQLTIITNTKLIIESALKQSPLNYSLIETLSVKTQKINITKKKMITEGLDLEVIHVIVPANYRK